MFKHREKLQSDIVLYCYFQVICFFLDLINMIFLDKIYFNTFQNINFSEIALEKASK